MPSKNRSYSGPMTHRLVQLTSHVPKIASTSKMAVVFDEKTPDINLYTAGTPNGIKISITLEELGYLPPPPALSFSRPLPPFH